MIISARHSLLTTIDVGFRRSELRAEARGGVDLEQPQPGVGRELVVVMALILSQWMILMVLMFVFVFVCGIGVTMGIPPAVLVW